MRQVLYYLGLWLVLSSIISCKQQNDYFEGVIHYSVDAEVFFSSINKELILDDFGRETTFYFSNGNYLQEYTSTDIEKEFFIKKENKFYTKYVNSDTIFVSDGALTDEYIVKDSIEGKVKLDTYDCNVYSVICSGINNDYKYNVRYHYADLLKINSEWFAKTRQSNYDKIYKNMSALPLMMEYEHDAYKIIITATKIEKKKLPDLKKNFKTFIEGKVLVER